MLFVTKHFCLFSMFIALCCIAPPSVKSHWSASLYFLLRSHHIYCNYMMIIWDSTFELRISADSKTLVAMAIFNTKIDPCMSLLSTTQTLKLVDLYKLTWERASESTSCCHFGCFYMTISTKKWKGFTKTNWYGCSSMMWMQHKHQIYALIGSDFQYFAVSLYWKATPGEDLVSVTWV